MSMRPIGEDDVQGFVDERLSPARRREVEAYLGDHPEAQARVARMIALRDDMRAAFAPIAAEPVPARLNLARIVEVRRRAVRPAWQVMAAGVLLLLGGAGGWGLREAVSPVPSGIDALAQAASMNYAVYAPDHTRPVELAAADRDELAGWFSARLRRTVGVPDLSGAGYRLMGGRLVATPQGPAGLLMYDDSHGARFVMLMRPMTVPGDAPMRPHATATSNGYAWAQDGLGYSLAGAADPAVLHPLADTIRRATAKSL
ncbi:anti-sigma factor family protein [Methylobacterium sp. Leaf118]|uniref:anti-sigma factor family protein n=1 Tax=Methylobacterium sp. Leaf118 TaxID=2876562 RepID=UPI001E527BEB|nr:anti-sigma factor [Methylobacterium sp. Leaf118]